MPDPITFAGWIAAVIVFVVQEVRRHAQTRPAAGTEPDQLRAIIREELDPIKDLADKNDHDNAINRKEIGYATAEIKYFGRQFDAYKGEVESKLARLGESFDARVSTVELGLERVIMDTESKE